MNKEKDNKEKDNKEKDNSSWKNFITLIVTLGVMTGLSLGSFTFCTWYNCNSWSSLMGLDLICNACVNTVYHLRNYQIALYGSMFTLITYKMTSLINKVLPPTDIYIFEDYSLGRNSPRRFKVK